MVTVSKVETPSQGDIGETALKEILQNLDSVERSLLEVIEDHRSGEYGYITREWGFSTPNGLGGKLGGKFQPWEDKLDAVKTFFWPPEAYLFMEEENGKRPEHLPPHGEMLKGNVPLHEFLMEPPSQEVELTEADLVDYRTSARLFLLLGTLSHLCGNAVRAALPLWIEDPLRVVAERLQVEPTLTGHFLVQENWIWRPDPDIDDFDNVSVGDELFEVDLARNITLALLTECKLEDRRYRFTIYKNCFVGSQAVDVLMKFASSRAEAVRIGRKLNEAVGLFYHVTNDHMLKDEFLFYRFNKNWRRKSSGPGDDSTLNTHQDSEIDDAQNRNVMIVRRNPATRKKRGSDGSENEGTGSLFRRPFRLSRSMSGQGDSAASKEEGSKLKRDSFRSENNDDAAVDNGQNQGGESGSSKKGTGHLFPIPSPLKRLGSASRPSQDDIGDDCKSVPSLDDLQSQDRLVQALQVAGSLVGGSDTNGSFREMAAAIAAMRKVTVKDRRYRLTVYRKCFLGSQLIDVLLEHECAHSRADALLLGREINARYSLFEHVCRDHELKDEYLFYRFTSTFKQMVAVGSDASSESSSVGVLEAPDNSLRSGSFDVAKQPNDPETYSVLSPAYIPSPELTEFDSVQFSFVEPNEFRIENIVMLYPAFQNNHERVNQLIPACMGYSLRALPFTVLDVLSTMQELMSAKLNGVDVASINTSKTADRANSYQNDVQESIKRLADLLYQIAFSLSRCKEQFQQMSTDPTKATFNSKHVSIRQTQPLSNGVLVRRTKGGEPLPSKGTTGTQFPYFHLLDWLLGRFQFKDEDEDVGLIAKISSSIDRCFPVPHREFIQRLSKLKKSATLRSFLDIIGRPKHLMVAYNHLIECYAGQGGVLSAHCRKLYSYMHNDLQSSTSGTNHAGLTSTGGCPMSAAENNHRFASMMFNAMQGAVDERWRLRMTPLMSPVEKKVYSASESGGFTTVALDLAGTGLRYEYGDVVRVLLPNTDKTTLVWTRSLASLGKQFLKLNDLPSTSTYNGWGWKDLWEAMGWMDEEEREGVPLRVVAKYIEQAQIRDHEGKARWVNNPIDLCGSAEERLFAVPSPIAPERIASLVPVSPRIYSVSGVESDRVFLLVSMPLDGARHHGYERMADPRVEQVYCSFAPATFFLVPPKDVNLVCVASGTGISPFVGLVDAIGSRPGTYTIAHQCRSSDLFLSNCQTWLNFTALNPGAVVMGFISGDRSRRNCPMRYVISNGLFEDTSLLRRHNSTAYYFQSPDFQNRLREVYKHGGINLAYCCGGVHSAVEPLKKIVNENSWDFEFFCESYSISTRLHSSDFASQIGGTVVDLNEVSPVHVGGDQILRQVQSIALERQEQGSADALSVTPDHSSDFWKLHPHAYNLHRCLRAPLDADFEAFVAFLNRQDASKSVMAISAAKYAQIALASPEDSKVVRVASELQSSALRHQLDTGDAKGATKSAETLMALLQLVPNEDENSHRWKTSLDMYRASQVCDHETAKRG